MHAGPRGPILAPVTYRDDDEAQRARIEELERKLDAAGVELAMLRGEKVAPSAGTRVEHSRLSGGPRKYAHEVLVPHAIDEAGYEAIAAVLRARLSLNATQVGRTLTVPGVFSLAREAEGTRIRLSADWSAMRGGVIASSVLAGFFGTAMTAGVIGDLISHGVGWHHTMVIDGALGVGVIALATTFTVGVGWLTRRKTSRNSKKLLADYEGTFAAILSLAEEHAVREVVPTRVAESAGDDAEPAHEARSREARSGTP